jgi:hypothetical protein
VQNRSSGEHSSRVGKVQWTSHVLTVIQEVFL